MSPTAGYELARWQGRTEERLDWLEESVGRVEKACVDSNKRVETAVMTVAERVGLVELATGKSSVKVALLVAILGAVGGIVGTAVATLVVYLALGAHP